MLQFRQSQSAVVFHSFCLLPLIVFFSLFSNLSLSFLYALLSLFHHRFLYVPFSSQLSALQLHVHGRRHSRVPLCQHTLHHSHLFNVHGCCVVSVLRLHTICKCCNYHTLGFSTSQGFFHVLLFALSSDTTYAFFSSKKSHPLKTMKVANLIQLILSRVIVPNPQMLSVRCLLYSQRPLALPGSSLLQAVLSKWWSSQIVTYVFMLPC